MKKEDTALRLAQRKYEEAHKEERKAKSGTFSTYMPRKELDEINEFLRRNNISKVELIRKGFEVLKEQLNNN